MTVLAEFGGAVWGFVRGLDYLSTLPVAVVEGAVIIGIPGLATGLILGALTEAAVTIRLLLGRFSPR